MAIIQCVHDCDIVISDVHISATLILFSLVEFTVININWLYIYYVVIDYYKIKMNFYILDIVPFSFNGSIRMMSCLISTIKTCKMIS